MQVATCSQVVQIFKDKVPDSYPQMRGSGGEPDPMAKPVCGYALLEDESGDWHVWPAPDNADDLEDLYTVFLMHFKNIEKVYLEAADYKVFEESYGPDRVEVMVCGKKLDCGSDCYLASDHRGPCLCCGDIAGPGSCPA